MVLYMNRNKKIMTCNLIDNFNLKWSIKILVLSFVLSTVFSLLSDVLLTSASFLLASLIILVLMFVGVIFDMIGVAITSCNAERFVQMQKDGVKYAKESLYLIKNSDKISVICCDIIGDICSILSGACGACIVYKLISTGIESSLVTLVSAVVSGVIACLTIFLKSLEKSVAVNKNKQITLFIAKCIKRFIK